MPITIEEVRRRLTAFAHEYADASEERQEAQSFQIEFYRCFGIERRKARLFEERVPTKKGTTGFIDGFVPGKLLTEMKSRGISLDRAHQQAADYAVELTQPLPPYILTCNFSRFRLYSLDDGGIRECSIDELAKNAEWFMFLTDNPSQTIVEESPVDRDAAYAVAALHDAIVSKDFTGRDLEVFLTRLLFCLFADDTGIFGERQLFTHYLAGTKSDGTDLKGALESLFDEVLNVHEDLRQKTLGAELNKFAYVNGDLFKERSRIPVFNGELREKLLACDTSIDWSKISPAIFGAMFQGVLETPGDNAHRIASRRELGAHYTSERNILRVINPLFMEGLRQEFNAARRNKAKLEALHDKLAKLKLFDPACGCGNFLVIAYRELRRLEHEIIKARWGDKGPELLDISTRIRVNTSQFYGIEIDEAAAHIAHVALYITDEQMNEEARQTLGATRPTVPITSSPHIVCGNALQIDWSSVLPAAECSYIMGNPPFVGRQYQTMDQKTDLTKVFHEMDGAKVLDYVAAWYIKAAKYIQGTDIPVAFVSTNSITQGEQVAILWGELARLGVHIHFAHRTFRWSNEGRGIAAVHCVIVGFSLNKPVQCRLFQYQDITGEPEEIGTKQINPYLVDAPTVLIEKRRKPLCPQAPEMVFGSMPNDGGFLLLSPEKEKDIREADLIAANYIRRFMGADEFINNVPRYCLWLKDSTASDRGKSPEIKRRIAAVKEMRLASSREATQKLADTPYLFGEIRQPNGTYLAVPEVSSENRRYIPIGYLPKDTIASNKLYTVANATPYHFGILASSMHMAWTRAVCGRLKSDYQYSTGIVYNNLPWPENPTEGQKKKIEAATQAVLDARAAEEKRCMDQNQPCSLAILYAPGNMPAELVKAHNALDKAVDAAYGYKSGKDDASRVAFLFARYQELTG